MKLHQKLFSVLVLLIPVQLGRHFWPTWSYVFGLRIDYLSPTLYLTDILIFLVLFLWFLDKPKFKFKLVRLFLLLAIFLFLLVNALLAQNSGVALYKFFKILEFSLLALYVSQNNLLPAACHLLPVPVIYSSLMAIAQFVHQSSLNGVFWFLGERTFNAGIPGIAKTVINGQLLMRPYATFPHPNALAGFLLVGMILSLPYILKKDRLCSMFYILCSVSALVLTFSRAAWFTGLLIIFLRFTSRLSLITFFSGEAFIQRVELNKIALQLIKQYPLVGVGLNNFIPRLPGFWSSHDPIYLLQPVHNIYLLVASETGLVGLLVFLWFIYLTFKKLSIVNYPLSIALSAILALGFFDHYWLTLQQNQLLLAITLGLVWSKNARMASWG